MKKIAPVTLLLGALLFSISAISSELCPEISRAASKAAQDYRNAVGKVRMACASSFQECSEGRARADQMLGLLVAANEAMLAECVFIFPTTDDSLPITPETVAAAIDTFPVSALINCETFVSGSVFEVAIGCPSGWIINIPRSSPTLAQVTDTSFTYSVHLSAFASIPISASILGAPVSCTLNVTTNSPGVLVSGTATFSSSTIAGSINRLQLQVNTIDLGAAQLSGCATLGDVINFVGPTVLSSARQLVATALSGTFCGAEGPELFGPCP